MRIPAIAVLALSVCACAGPAASRPDRSAVLAEGKSRHVPVYIYSASWSSSGGRMKVGVASFDEKDIYAIELGVSECGAKGEIQKPKPLFLNGPFVKNEVYAAFPSWPIDYADYATGTADMAQDAVSSGHLVIRSITLHYPDGSRQAYDQDMSPFIDKSISNFCANSPDGGNLPPSATVQRH